MTDTFIQLALVAVLALPAYAGQEIIRETDTAIIVEYTGGTEEKLAAEKEKQEQEKAGEILLEAERQKTAQQKALEEKRAAKADRSAARRASEEEE